MGCGLYKSELPLARLELVILLLSDCADVGLRAEIGLPGGLGGR